MKNYVTRNYKEAKPLKLLKIILTRRCRPLKGRRCFPDVVGSSATEGIENTGLRPQDWDHRTEAARDWDNTELRPHRTETILDWDHWIETTLDWDQTGLRLLDWDQTELRPLDWDHIGLRPNWIEEHLWETKQTKTLLNRKHQTD